MFATMRFKICLLMIHFIFVKFADLFTINTGEIIVNVRSTPTTKGNFSQYTCTFDVAVQCFWQKNDKIIHLAPYDYIDKFNTTSHTKDCTIEAKYSNDTIRFNAQNPFLDCKGMIKLNRLQYNLGASVILKCKSENAICCNWKRNTDSILTDEHYRYVNDKAGSQEVTDCSIIIYNISANDDGIWECGRKVTPSDSNTNINSIAFYAINVVNVLNVVSISTTITVPTTTPSTTLPWTNATDNTTYWAANATPIISEWNTTMTTGSEKLLTDDRTLNYDAIVPSFNGLTAQLTIIPTTLIVVVVIVLGFVVFIVDKCKRNKDDSQYFTSTSSQLISSDFEEPAQTTNEPYQGHSDSSHYLEPINHLRPNDVIAIDGVVHIYEEITRG